MTEPNKRIPTPPQSIGAEQAVLGSLMIDSRALAKIANHLAGEDFYRDEHRAIFDAIIELAARGQTVDIVTVDASLAARGVAPTIGLGYLGELARDTPTAANIRAYADVVRDRAVLRRLGAFADRLKYATSESNDRQAAELVFDAQKALIKFHEQLRLGHGLVSAPDLVREFCDDLDRRMDGKRGLSIGLADFDELTGGLEPGDLVVIASRPGMGKTALLVSIATAIDQSRGVAVFSAEMPAQQLMRRCVARFSKINQRLLRRPEQLRDSDFEGIAAAATEIADRRIWIDDRALPPLDHIRGEVTSLKARVPALGLVVVDYVQLVAGAGANRYEQLRDVAYGLKGLAKDLGIPIIVLAQLNRSVESRESKRPHLSDLRDSGAIEESADIVGMLYSEGYYDRDFIMPYVLECAIEKNRNGERGECLWRFDGEHSLISMLESGAVAEYRQLRAKARRQRSDDL